MSPDDELQRTFADICVLFELAVSVGQSLELRENCERFLATLMARKNLGYAAVWLRSESWPGRPTPDGALALAYGVPRVHVRERVLLQDRFGDRFGVALRAPISVAAGEPDFDKYVIELGIGSGVYAILPLGTLGFLKLHSAVRQTRFTEVELNQLDTIARKFTQSLEGCIAHETAVLQAAERERAEREREAMREQLQQSHKMEAIGRLAGGVAHDFNNLLTTICGHAELLRRDTQEETSMRRDLDAILTASKRAAELTGQLLAFSRRRKLRAEEVNVDKLIEEVARLLSHTIDPRIDIVCRLALGDAVVTGDSSRLQSALLNLAVNARDAMPEGGTLTFTTTLVELDDAYCRRQPMPTTPGTYAELRVADTGIGMDPEMAKRIFEPFFTTKELGRGTGLGLAAVYGTVTSHSGSIQVRSVPGQGATFTMYLPAARPRVAARPTPPEGAWLEGRGTLMLVDDQSDVRRVTASILQRLGYVVLSAGDGLAALEIYHRERARIRLVLLDVRMPRMDGAETLRQLRRLSPTLPVLIVSGFGADKDLEIIRAIGVQGVVEKPVTVAELSEAVARALESA